MSNEAIIIVCPMGRFNGFLSVKCGDYYYMTNGAIQWIFKCQIGRLFLYVKWDNSMDFFSAKWGDYNYMPNGAIHYYMPNEAIKTIMSYAK